MKPKPLCEALWCRVSTYINETDLAELEKLCQIYEKSKSQLLRYALKEALFNAETISFAETET